MKLIFAAALACFAAIQAPASQAAVLRYTFIDCGPFIGCDGGSAGFVGFDVADVVVAPPAPSAGAFSAQDPLSVVRKVDGDFLGVAIQSFNSAGFIGSNFVFDDLVGANGVTPASRSVIGAAVASALNLSWDVGTYLGLARADCLNVECTRTTTIRSFIQLVVAPAPDDVAVPAPGGGLMLAASAAAAMVARRRSQVANGGRGRD